MRGNWLVIADDLTGACDSAVQFAAAGLRTVATLAGVCPPDGAEVVAFSTESRDVDGAEAVRRLRGVSATAHEAGLIFKKIDSTLRGNTGAEIVAAVDAFACEAVVVNPAFPAMGRVVENGCLRVTTDATFRPVEIGEWLRTHGAEACRHVETGGIAAALDAGARFVSLDAVSQEELVRVAAEAMAVRRRILWAGSAGLAAALASLQGGGDVPAMPSHTLGPVLFCLGSDHPVTMEQERRLVERRGAVILQAASDVDVAGTLAGGRHVVLRIPRGQIAVQRLGALIALCRPAALVLSGGDTASLVFRALGGQAIELRREFAAGIPAGVFRGGTFEGTIVITKSGGFGAPDDLVHIANYFYA